MGGFRPGRVFAYALALAVAGATFAAPALAQGTSQNLRDRNLTDPDDGKSQTELRRLYDAAFAAMLADPGNLDKSFRFAGLAVRVGDLEGAVAALERMLLINADLPRVRLELGVLYFRLGSYEAARNYLVTALETPNMPPDVRERAEDFLARINKQKSPTRLYGTVLAGIRYQSNANAAPTGGVKVGGFDAELDDNSTAASDFNVFVASQTTHLWDFGWQSGGHLDTQVNLYSAYQFKRHEVDANVLVASTGPRFYLAPDTFGGLSVRIAGALEFVMLDGREDYRAPGAGISLDQRWETTALSLGFDWRNRTYHNSKDRPFNSQQDGDEYAGRLSWEQVVNDWLAFSMTAGYARYDARAGWETYREKQFAAGVTLQTVPSPFIEEQNIVLAFYLVHLRSNYDKPDPTVDPDVKRKDKDWRLAATMSVPLNEEFSFILQGGYNKRESSLPNYEYKNWFTMTGIAWRF